MIKLWVDEYVVSAFNAGQYTDIYCVTNFGRLFRKDSNKGWVQAIG